MQQHATGTRETHPSVLGQLQQHQTARRHAQLRLVDGRQGRHAARRGYDLAARLGGEEFAVAWYDVDQTAALRLAEQARARIEKLGIEHGDSPHRWLSFSAGVVSLIADVDTTAEAAVSAADRALYAAKRAGRNRVEPGQWTPQELPLGGA